MALHLRQWLICPQPAMQWLKLELMDKPPNTIAKAVVLSASKVIFLELMDQAPEISAEALYPVCNTGDKSGADGQAA